MVIGLVASGLKADGHEHDNYYYQRAVDGRTPVGATEACHPNAAGIGCLSGTARRSPRLLDRASDKRLRGGRALAIGITTLPRSGPNCLSDCITYPYTDAAAFVPRDYLWMYPAALVAALFVELVVCIHHRVAEAQQRFSLIGVPFAVSAATALIADYLIQLTVVQPSLLKGETAALSLVTQYNPHGIFIALENVGYLAKGIGLLCIGLAFPGRSWLERVLRWRCRPICGSSW